ncbi:MAG: XisI protein [Cyanobacteria bacterium P01_F01_bin.150]
MADLEHYRQSIQRLLEELYSYEHSSEKLRDSDVESQLVFDRDHDHYLMLDVGWDQKQFVYGTIVHIDIKDGKIWIQRNNTEISFAERLVAQGIPKDHIVLGLHSPFMRKASGYAAG